MDVSIDQWFVVQIYLGISEEVEIGDYGVYHFKWYTRHFEDFSSALTV